MNLFIKMFKWILCGKFRTDGGPHSQLQSHLELFFIWNLLLCAQIMWGVESKSFCDSRWKIARLEDGEETEKTTCSNQKCCQYWPQVLPALDSDRILWDDTKLYITIVFLSHSLEKVSHICKFCNPATHSQTKYFED